VLVGHAVRFALDPRDAGRGELVGIVGQGVVGASIMRAPDDAWVEVRAINPGAAAQPVGALWRGRGGTLIVAARLPPDPSRGAPPGGGSCIDDWGDLSPPMMPALVDRGPVHLAMRAEPGSATIESSLEESVAGALDGPAELTVDGAPVAAAPGLASARRATFAIDPRCADGRLVPRVVTVRATWRTRYRFAANPGPRVHAATVELVLGDDGLLYKR
jgi:hypothetical protein